MKIAHVNIAAPVYVPAGEYLNGEILAAPAWAHVGECDLSETFARTQEANGYLEIDTIDGVAVVWGACCNAGH